MYLIKCGRLYYCANSKEVFVPQYGLATKYKSGGEGWRVAEELRALGIKCTLIKLAKPKRYRILRGIDVWPDDEEWAKLEGNVQERTIPELKQGDGIL